MVIGIGGTLLTVAGTVLTIYLKIKPIVAAFKDKLDAIKSKVDNPDMEDISSKLQSLDLATKITDLKAKINNPTISDELKQQYIAQLEATLELKAKLDAGLAKVEDVTSKF
jgi:hypothetical protein